MGLAVVIQNERGEVIDQVGDGRNYLHRLLPRPEDQSYQCLRFSIGTVTPFSITCRWTNYWRKWSG